MRRITLSAALLALLALIAGGVPAAAEPIKDVAVTEAKFDDLDKAVTAGKGKVVLVDFWATWCLPCVKKFPHFVETNKKYKDKGLLCVSVSLDPKGKEDKYDKDAVQKFLKEKGATFPNYVLMEYIKDEAKVTKRFGMDGGIPFMVLFDKDGKMVWNSEQKELKDDELDKLIEAELARK